MNAFVLQEEGELELAASRARYSEAETASLKANGASHSETLRDTAPVVDGLKVTSSLMPPSTQH